VVLEAALELAVSNAQTAAQITKLKLLKRAAYGRSSSALSRARPLRAS
jgi:transposase